MRSPLIEEDTVSEASSGQHASPFELELLLKRIGGTGLFQYFLIGFIGVLFGFSGMLQLSFLLTGRTPLLLCPNDGPSGGGRTISGDGCTIAEACDQPPPARQYLTPNYTFTSYASEFDLICDQSYLNALLTSSIYLGLGAGAPFAGALADRFGRKPVLLAGLFLSSTAHLASALVPEDDWNVAAGPLYFSKFLVGVGLGTFLPAAMCYLE
jgi:MFS family permease